MKRFTLTLIVTTTLMLVGCNNQKKESAEALVAETEAIVEFRDHGADPFVFDIEAYTLKNEAFRQALWTGKNMQLTLMKIMPGEDIGLEQHNELDQFLRIESGAGIVYMGDEKENLTFQATVEDDFSVMIPAGKWHNLVNTGDVPILLYSIYSPAEHPFGTVHNTKAEAVEAEKNHTH
ncbi:MAG: cupin domain-containing protein [Bacteroidales bacterium]|jgi:mannose-6-phosphate isomerase-like protein (cupin superfamily)|nr:cupin domain-containing protein [Bacteroidales bacterium]